MNRGEVIPREWHGEVDPSPTIPRVLLEAVLGTVGAGIGLIPGGILALTAFCLGSSCDGDEESRAILGVAIALAGMSAGAAAGIVGGAGMVRGQGNYWPTVGGAALGALGGSVLGIALAASNSDEAGLFAFFAGPVLGGIIGYELSHSSTIAERYSHISSAPRMVPTLTVSARGGVIGGLLGSF